MSVGLQSCWGPTGIAPMKSESGVVSCGVALNVPGEPLLGMPTQPARDRATATSRHARRARASHRRPGPVLATRAHPADLAGGVRARAQAGGDLGLVRAERQRRAREWLPGYPRQGQPEHRALAGFAPGLQPAAVQPRVLERDGQAQAGTAAGAGPGRVGPPEPVEDLLFLA